MRLLYYELKDKADRKYIFPVYLLMLIILVVYHARQYHSEPAVYLQSFQGMQKSALFLLVCMTFLAYEIFCDFQKREWREILRFKSNGILKTVLVKNVLLVLLVVIAFLSILFIEYLKLMRGNMGNDFPFWDNMRRVLVLNDLVLPLVGTMIGETAALVSRKRWSGYIGILVILLLVSGLFERMNTALYMTVGINLDLVFRFFQFEQPNSRWVVDDLYLVPAEDYRFFLFGTWIAGCLGIISFVSLKKKSIQVSVFSAFALLSVFWGIRTAHPGNIVNYNMNVGSAAAKQTEFENDLPEEERKADFTVEKYSMDLQIEDELEADVVMELGTQNLHKWRFTLYRGYQITEITDENENSLTYDRENDYITVYSSEKIREIHMRYHGYQQSFYSNRFGVMLPGYFPYYPQPGFRKVFRNETVQTYLYYGFNTETESLQEADYEVRVSCNGGAVSNLEKKNNVFFGKTAAPTIMGGFVSEDFREDGHYIFPEMVDLSEVSMKILKRDLRKYCEVLGLDPAPFDSLKHVITVPSSVYIGNSWGKHVIVGDCLFLGTDDVGDADLNGLSQEIVKQYMNVVGERDVLLNVLFSYLGDDMYLRDLKPMDKEQFFSVVYDENDVSSEDYWEMISEMVPDRMFLTLMSEYESREEYVVQRTVQYLMEPDSSENSAEFMQNLYNELEEQNGLKSE